MLKLQKNGNFSFPLKVPVGHPSLYQEDISYKGFLIFQKECEYLIVFVVVFDVLGDKLNPFYSTEDIRGIVSSGTGEILAGLMIELLSDPQSEAS